MITVWKYLLRVMYSKNDIWIKGFFHQLANSMYRVNITTSNINHRCSYMKENQVKKLKAEWKDWKKGKRVNNEKERWKEFKNWRNDHENDM